MVLFPFHRQENKGTVFGLCPHVLHVVLELRHSGAYKVGFEVTESLVCSGLPDGLH